MFTKLNGTYGYHNLANKTILFNGQDSEELFLKSVQTQAKSWFFRDYPITYKFNSIGHRSMEPHLFERHNPTVEDYILFIGCSFTEGIGLAVEQLYSTHVANYFNMHCYNLGLGGSGVDLVATNLSLWLNRYNRPKAVVIQWPHYERKFYRPNKDEVHSVGSWVLDSNALAGTSTLEAARFKALMQADAFKHYFEVIRLNTMALLHVSGIPFVELYALGYTETPDFIEAFSEHIAYPPLQDLARDLAHPGIQWNKSAAARIIEKLSPQLTKIG